MNKVLVGVFIVLLVITVGEVVFLIFQKNPPLINKPQNNTVKMFPTPLPNYSFDEVYVVDGFNERLRDKLYSSTLTNIYLGEVVEITAPDASKNKEKYQSRIAIKSPGKDSPTYLYFNYTGPQKVKVVTKSNNQETEASYESIKKGDRIMAEIIMDMTKERFNRLKSSKIIIENQDQLP